MLHDCASRISFCQLLSPRGHPIRCAGGRLEPVRNTFRLPAIDNSNRFLSYRNVRAIIECEEDYMVPDNGEIETSTACAT
jgi:hypothetical protein